MNTITIKKKLKSLVGVKTLAPPLEVVPSTQANGHSRCMVVFEDLRSYGYRMVDNSKIPEGSIPIMDDGLTHLLNYNKNTLKPIQYLPTDNKNKTPQDCMEATFWEELAGVVGVGFPPIEKIKLGIFVGLIIAEFILIFLTSAMRMG